MAKVLQIATFKQQVRENDLQEELEVDQGGEKGGGRAGRDEKVFGKDKGVEKLDPFFVEAAAGSGDEIGNDQDLKQQVEKRTVMRDGRIPKFQKNIQKM